MQNAESAVATLLALKAMGVRVAIDDFGTGYSCFTYLRRFPVDTLKVGQSFVQEITADPEGSPLVGAMISIGTSLKQASRCSRSGNRFAARLSPAPRVRRGEGSYFGNPVVAKQVARLFKSSVQEGMLHWMLASCVSPCYRKTRCSFANGLFQSSRQCGLPKLLVFQ
jgi:diguanylate cyclase